MKRNPHQLFHRRRFQSGSAVLAMLTFLVLMGILSIAISRSNYQLRQEINLIDKKQTARLAASINVKPVSPVVVAP